MGSEGLDEGVDVGFGGGPVGDESYGGGFLAERAPKLEGGEGAQLLDFFVGEDEELLVGRGVDELPVSLFEETLFEFHGEVYGAFTDFEV